MPRKARPPKFDIPFLGLRPIFGAMGTSCPVGVSPVGVSPVGVSPVGVSPPPTPALPGLVGSPASAVPGSVWVAGSELHYVAANGAEYSGTGTSVDTPAGAVRGSMYLNAGTDTIYYVDSSGIRRSLQAVSLGAKAAAAVRGSAWVERAQTAGKQLVWTGGTNNWQWSNGV